MKRLLAALTAFCLLCALPVTAAAQGGPTLVCRQEDGSISLTLEGLEETVYALQLELVLKGSCPDAAFASAVTGAYTPECRAEAQNGETAVTIYMAAPEGPLTSAGSLHLGTLNPGGSVTLPQQGELILLNRELKPCSGSGTVSLQIRQTPSQGSSGGGGGSSSGWRPPATPVQKEDEADPSQTPSVSLPFLDIPEDYWCRDEVSYVYQQGLMNGTSATTFDPTGTTTRGMIVAILYRMEGSPSAGLSAFTDVDAGAYYASAVAWASANGIVNGYDDGTFRPGNRITREQMAAFLFRYARYQGRDVSAQADLSAYTDAGQISSYALEPLRWANAQGLINGVSSDTISPAGNATRAQAAVILTRFARSEA